MVVVKLRNVDQIRDRNTEKLLASKKLHLVLDLDQTLVHCMKLSEVSLEKREHILKNKDTCMIMGGSRIVKLRPQVREFLKEASSMFNISVYTMGEVIYANCIVDILNKESKNRIIEKVVSREDCTTNKRKGLDVVLSRKEVVLIVDDKEDVWMECDRANVITIKPYYFFNKHYNGDDDDHDELCRVLGVLRDVHTRFYGKNVKRDVREVLRETQVIKGNNNNNNNDGELRAGGCLKIVFKIKDVNGDEQRLYTSTTISNGEKKMDDKKVKKREREQDCNNCVRAMLHHGKECKWLENSDMLCHSL